MKAPPCSDRAKCARIQAGEIEMNKKYSEYLKQIIDDSMKNTLGHSDKEISDFFNKYKISYNDSYAFFLKYYGNDYIKDSYYYRSKDDKYEMGILFGLDTENGNICKEIENNKDFLPDFVIPIIAMPGGDFVCLDKNKGSIYLWFHEKDSDNLLFIEKDFETFILNFTEIEENSNVKPVDITIDKSFDALLREAAKKI